MGRIYENMMSVRALGLGLAVLLLPGLAASADTRSYRILRAASLELDGGGPYNLAAAGDVDGDGVADLIVSEEGASEQGTTHLIFGGTDSSSIDTSNLGDKGFSIHGGSANGHAFYATAAGDVNDDGYADIAIGSDTGTVYVVFGRADPSDVDLLMFDAGLQGSQGYRIVGNAMSFGRTVDGAEDINQDGLDDVVVGAPLGGRAFVVYGKKDGATVNVDMPGMIAEWGWSVRFPAPDNDSQRLNFVASLGDVNGDRTPDIGIGRANMDGKALRCCASWVVFGGPYQDEMDVRQLEDEGFKLKGDAGIYQVGDVNGDGLADIGQSGRVVFGKSDAEPIPPGYVPRELGFDFRGTLGLDGAAGLSDVNGDGLFDVGITAPNADYGGRNVGAAFVVYGSRKGVDVNVEDLGGRGFRLDGPRAASEDSHLAAGYQLAGPGDFTGDGLADILVDALGRAYLVPGR